MASHEFRKGERIFIDCKPTYSSNDATASSYWSESAKRGEPVLEAEVTTAYFYLKRNKDDTNADAALDWNTSDDATKLLWLTEGSDPVISILRAKFGEAQDVLDGLYFYEFRAKMSDSAGGFVTLDSGTIEILDSVVGTP